MDEKLTTRRPSTESSAAWAPSIGRIRRRRPARRCVELGRGSARRGTLSHVERVCQSHVNVNATLHVMIRDTTFQRGTFHVERRKRLQAPASAGRSGVLDRRLRRAKPAGGVEARGCSAPCMAISSPPVADQPRAMLEPLRRIPGRARDRGVEGLDRCALVAPMQTARGWARPPA